MKIYLTLKSKELLQNFNFSFGHNLCSSVKMGHVNLF